MKGKWKVLHWIIVVNFVLEIAYGAIQVFFILGGGGILFGGSETVDQDLFVRRRLYAIETWIAVTGLAIYLAIVYRDQLKKEQKSKIN